jgi:ABC-type transport system involved in multi-copper enzyme maturation permease subunit
MAEGTSPLPNARAALAGLLQNPVTLKELRGRMRGRRAFAVLTLYLILLSSVLVLVYMSYAASAAIPSSTAARTAGKGLFAAVLFVQVALVAFIGPAFTAGAISGERERQTFDLLRTTLLSAESFVLGKLISALSYIFLLVLVSIPLQSIAFLLGGLSLVELVLSQLVILVAAVAYALYGLWCSAVMRSTLTATVATFAGMLFLTIGLPIIAFVPIGMLGVSLSTSTRPYMEIVLVYGGLLLASINLPAALIVSEAFLLQQDALFFFSETIGSSATRVWLFSPWWVFIILHVIAAILLYIATVRRVRRISDV